MARPLLGAGNLGWPRVLLVVINRHGIVQRGHFRFSGVNDVRDSLEVFVIVRRDETCRGLTLHEHKSLAVFHHLRRILLDRTPHPDFGLRRALGVMTDEPLSIEAGRHSDQREIREDVADVETVWLRLVVL